MVHWRVRDRLGQLEDRFFVTGVFRKRPLAPRHAVHCSGDRGRHPDRVFDAASGANRFGDVSLRSCCCLQPGERVHDQDGECFYDHDVDRGDLYWDCAALAGCPRLRVVAATSVRQLLFQLELSCFPALGVSDQRFHSEGQPSVGFRLTQLLNASVGLPKAKDASGGSRSWLAPLLASRVASSRRSIYPPTSAPMSAATAMTVPNLPA